MTRFPCRSARGNGAWKGGSRLCTAPPVDRFVVCTPTPACPNTLVTDDGRWTAHVDLTLLDVADRWADIAVATISIEWNYDARWEEPPIEAYGVAPDHERLAYYRDLTP